MYVGLVNYILFSFIEMSVKLIVFHQNVVLLQISTLISLSVYYYFYIFILHIYSRTDKITGLKIYLKRGRKSLNQLVLFL